MTTPSLYTMWGLVYYGVLAERPHLTAQQIQNAISAYAAQPDVQQANVHWEQAGDAVTAAVITLGVRDLADELYGRPDDPVHG